LAPQTLSDDELRKMRLYSQRLDQQARRDGADPAEIVRYSAGIQAQDVKAGPLSVRVRGHGLHAGDVDRARQEERSIVRTWVMRGTLHFIPAEDICWMLGLLGPIFIRSGHGRMVSLGLDDATAEQGIQLLLSILSQDGPFTRAEIVEQLRNRGFPLEGQARIHLLGLAALQGRIIQGADRGRQPTFGLLEDWLGTVQAASPESPAAELARRHLRAFGPTTPADFAVWSGLSLTQARGAWKEISDPLVEFSTSGGAAWMLRSAVEAYEEILPQPLSVRLLPAFDTYLLGYRNRDLVLPPAYATRIQAGGGVLNPALLVDGRVLGQWKLVAKRAGMEVQVTEFEELSREVLDGLDEELAELSTFFNSRTSLRVEKG
jgi:hypothetical protein